MSAPGPGPAPERSEVWHVNDAIFRHEAETPMGAHDGRCCARARVEGAAAYAAQQTTPPAGSTP